MIHCPTVTLAVHCYSKEVLDSNIPRMYKTVSEMEFTQFVKELF